MAEMGARNEDIDEEEPENLPPEIPEEIDIEAPEADAAEQYRLLREEGSEWPDHIPPDADPADATEQNRAIDLDEDDYR
ncbi:hypothetical protein [Streptosporangium sp. NPDC004631]